MPSFQVLDRTKSVHRHLLLEASAGTGKTFSIENIVARLLIETDSPLTIDTILVVTFTRIATAELKERIHSNLEKLLELIKKKMRGESVNQFPDYLLAYFEKDPQAILKAKKLIEKALFYFDKAQIYTIHGFCWRMLKNYSIEAKISLEAKSLEDNSLSATLILKVIRDFLGNEILEKIFSSAQLKLLMKQVKNKSEKLQKDLFEILMRGIQIQSTPSFAEYLIHFQKTMEFLKQEHKIEGQKIIQDFLVLAPSYKELKNVQKQIIPEKMSKIERFSVLFDQNEWDASDLNGLIEDGVFILQALHPSLLMVKAKPLDHSLLHYPKLLKILEETLEPLISQARNPAYIFTRLANECQNFMQKYKEQEEFFGHHDLLLQMKKAVAYPEFVEKIRSHFSAAIVDEFQDTDPLQWEIFSCLFAAKDKSWKGYLHLVGDPKQSIYAFRQADIYTYLSAAKHLGEDALVSLDTNFRSQESLIEGVNFLFKSAAEPFSLPRINQSLAFRCVSAGKNEKLCNEPAIVFWEIQNQEKSKSTLNTLEEEIIFPAIVKEILKLTQSGKQLNQFAILIADKFQAERVCRYLGKFKIPTKSQKAKDISTSDAVLEMKELIQGVLHGVSDHSTDFLNIALAGRLIGMNHREIYELKNGTTFLNILTQFKNLKALLIQEGFYKFYHSFMHTSWHSDKKTVLERLLSELEGIEFYRVWQDLADLLIAEEYKQNLSSERLLVFLDQLDVLSKNEDERLKAYLDPDEEGIAVMTIHSSKGLEFSIVFALGLVKRTRSLSEDLFPAIEQNSVYLTPVKNEYDPKFLHYCEECDAEKMRQLYVALTRAKEKMYLPYILEETQKELKLGCASPMDLFLARLNQNKTDYSGLYKRIKEEDGSSLAEVLNQLPERFELIKLTDQKEIFQDRSSSALPILKQPPQVTVIHNHLTLQSFTSLSRTKNIKTFATEENLSIPHAFHTEYKSPHTMPSGSDAGIILHQIFETIAFNSLLEISKPQLIQEVIAPFLKGTLFAPWETVIAEIVFSTLKTPLSKKDSFCLAELDPKKIFRETEFLYPCEEGNKMFSQVEANPGFIKGVVDLFFEHQGKYYVIDWKSNWLGPSLEFYQQSQLQEAMQTHHYHLQAAIYKQAFKKYLKFFDQRPFAEIFGGIYYLFVRGISNETGIYYVDHSEDT